MKLSSIKDSTVMARAQKLFVRLRTQRDLAIEMDLYHTEREAEERRRLEKTLSELETIKTQRMARIIKSQARYRTDLMALLQLTEDDQCILKLDTDDIKGYLLTTYEERTNAKE